MSASTGARAIPAQVAASMRALVDNTFARVFDRPYDVRTGDDFEQLILSGGGPSSLASAGAIAAVIARSTPWLERALPLARRSGAASRVIPAARMAKYALPVALFLTTALRHGVRELQVVASYVMQRLRDAGIEPDTDFVTAVSLSLVLEPDREPDLSVTPSRAAPGLLRRFLLRSVGRDSAAALRERARVDRVAIERLDVTRLWRDWNQRDTQARELPPYGS